MGDRRTEQGHDRIADDLVDPSAERGDVVGEPGETTIDQVLDLFGIAVLREAGEPDDVGEEHGDDPSLVGPSGEFVAARAAEPGAIDDLGLTSGTLHHPNLRRKTTSGLGRFDRAKRRSDSASIPLALSVTRVHPPMES